jgi:hypothetical protein
MWGFYLVELRRPSPESQPISNQPICNIEVPAFRGLGNSHNNCLKKRFTVTPQQFSTYKRTDSEQLSKDALDRNGSGFRCRIHCRLTQKASVQSIRSIWKELEDSTARARVRPAARLRRARPTCAGLGCSQCCN